MAEIEGLEYECLNVDVGSDGHVNDSGVLGESSVLEAIRNVSAGLLTDDALPNSDIASYVWVPMYLHLKNMIKLYPQQNLTTEKRMYNCRYRPGKLASLGKRSIVAAFVHLAKMMKRIFVSLSRCWRKRYVNDGK